MFYTSSCPVCSRKLIVISAINNHKLYECEGHYLYSENAVMSPIPVYATITFSNFYISYTEEESYIYITNGMYRTYVCKIKGHISKDWKDLNKAEHRLKTYITFS